MPRQRAMTTVTETGSSTPADMTKNNGTIAAMTNVQPAFYLPKNAPVKALQGAKPSLMDDCSDLQPAIDQACILFGATKPQLGREVIFAGLQYVLSLAGHVLTQDAKGFYHISDVSKADTTAGADSDTAGNDEDVQSSMFASDDVDGFSDGGLG